jgi:FkbM family methyltransferase
MKISIRDFFESGKTSNSQLKQDLFVMYHYEDRPGFFVEFGGLDGVDTSNTYLLEKDHGWNGIIVEPLPRFKDDLLKNRNCTVDLRCVYSVSNSLVTLGEVENFPAVSTLVEFKDYESMWKERRQNPFEHEVLTVSLDDLLDQHDAPETIDYLSIDTEGSEFTILASYSFKRNFNLMTVEYGNQVERDKIYKLLTSKNYIRVHQKVSSWEDWYAYKPWHDENCN